jgi:hypothetical protein
LRRLAEEKGFHWLSTALNPRSGRSGYFEGECGWRLHAVRADAAEKLSDVGSRPALCGTSPRHGWDCDLFIETECARCLAKVAVLKRAKGDP